MNSIPVFYTPKMVADSKSASPSAAKPAAVVASWQKQFPILVIEPVPVTLDEYARAHDRTFVTDILEGRRNNGFGNRSRAVAQSLPYTSGSMLSAARHVLLAEAPVAAAPCAGFHHATFDEAQGFCTFNGLMVTALALKEEGRVDRVGILDLDNHYGNGTDDIIGRAKAETWLSHFTGGEHFSEPSHAPEFFRQLPRILAAMAVCDIVLYQAGADPHVNDPGGWLTTAQLRERDAIVFDAFAANKIPIVWNLAGGYQVNRDGSIPKVLEIHDNTMRECVRAYL
jgi:acetoin utilization deacetylase AcuC-like enzyme